MTALLEAPVKTLAQFYPPTAYTPPVGSCAPSRDTVRKTTNWTASDVAAGRAVTHIMRDGLPRTDEQIAEAFREESHTVWSFISANGFPPKAGRPRHGRLHLVSTGAIRDTGQRRNTRSGATARVWVKA